MNQFYLVEITTKDKLIHQGILFRPRKPSFAKASVGKAILWVHGLTSTFYGHVELMNNLAQTCEKEGIGFAAFNNRGHDMISGMRKVNPANPKGYDYAMGGAGYEDFEKCIYDIAAGVDFLMKQGFKEIIVAGSSTGANKVCFYAATEHNPHVVGVILVSPTSDRLVPGFAAEKRKESLKLMQDLAAEGKGEGVLTGHHFFPLTPKRFLSLFTPGASEDTFDYGDHKPKLTYFSKITKPLLVIFGAIDESLDRPVEKVRKVFDNHAKSSKYQSTIIPNALHNFNGKEGELVKTIINWLKSL